MTNMKKTLPPEGRGYALGAHRKGYFSVVVPEDATWNFVENPTFGAGTVPYNTLSGALTDHWNGYTDVDSVLAAPDIALSIEGSGMIKVTPTGADDAGLYYEIADLPIDTYTFSAYYCGSAGSVFEAYFADNVGNPLSKRQEQRGSGVNNYARLHVTYANPSVQTVRLYLMEKSNGEGTLPLFHTSFWMCENKPYVTLPFSGFSREKFNISGKQQDLPYLWAGLPNFSRSYRSWHAFASGREVPLRDMGFNLEAIIGLGVNAVENQINDISSGGGIYNGTRNAQRIFTLVGTVYGEDLQDILDKRRQIYDAIRPRGRNVYGQPTTLLFRIYDEDAETWVGQPLHTYCRYQGGLEGSAQSETSEKMSLTFVSEDPFIYSSYRKSYDLNNTAEFNTYDAEQYLIIHRDTDGDWEQINLQTAPGTPLHIKVFAKGTDGTFYMGGWFDTVNGVANTVGILKYNPETGEVSACGTGVTTTPCIVYDILPLSDGKVVVCGTFDAAGGIVNTKAIAIYNPLTNTWSALGGGVVGSLHDPYIYRVKLSSENKVYACGSFFNADGIVDADYFAAYNLDTDTWEACGAPTGIVRDMIIINPSNYPLNQSVKIYCGGPFTSMAGVADTARIALWDGTSWSSVAGGLPLDMTIFSMAHDSSNGIIYSITQYDVGGISYTRLYSYNGIEFKILDLPDQNVGASTAPLTNLAMHNNWLCIAAAQITTTSNYNDIILKWKNNITITEEVSQTTTLYNAPTYLYEDKEELWVALHADVGQPANAVYPISTPIENCGEICFPYIRYTGECILNTLKNKSAIKNIMYDGYQLVDREIVHVNLDAVGTELPILFSSVHNNITSHILDYSDVNFYLLPGTNKMYSSIAGRGTYATNSMCFRERYASIDKAIEYVGG